MSKSDREGRNTAWDHAERYEAQSLAASPSAKIVRAFPAAAEMAMHLAGSGAVTVVLSGSISSSASSASSSSLLGGWASESTATANTPPGGSALSSASISAADLASR